MLNDRIFEDVCVPSLAQQALGTEPFALVLAKAESAAACLAEAISRLPLPTEPETVLCLGAGTDTDIADVGDCVYDPTRAGW